MLNLNQCIEKLPIRERLVLITLIITVVISATFIITFSSIQSQKAYNDKVSELQSLTEVAYKLLKFYNDKVENGLLTKEQAQAKALEHIRAMTYQNKRGYYFVIDYDNVYKLHPTLLEVEGHEYNEIEDVAGKKFLQELRNSALSSPNGGHVEYWYPKADIDINLKAVHDKKKVYPKLSYVKAFEPWQWYIGTGAFIDDINHSLIQSIVFSSLICLVLIVVFILLIQYFIDKTITKPINDLANVSLKLANNDLSVQMPEDTSQTEIGKLRRSFKKYVENQKYLFSKVDEQTNQLIQSISELKEAHEYKNQFLSNMSHELRTPLNAILGFSQLLKDGYYGDLNEKQLDYVETINKSGDHLLGLINNLLEISKIDAGLLELQFQAIKPSEVVEEVLNILNSYIQKKGIAVTVEYSNDIGLVNTDLGKFRQILFNLLTNAIQFNHQNGAIDIHVFKSNNDEITFNITDTGVGIEQSDIKEIFKEFYQAKSTKYKMPGGTGIGLSLTKRLVEIQNGSIGVESKVGEGSKFWFTLPAFSPLTKTVFPEAKKIFHSENTKKVLIADSHKTNITLMADIFTLYHNDVLFAVTSIELISLAKTEKPNLILLDTSTMSFNAMETVKKLKNIPETQNIPVIAIIEDKQSQPEQLISAHKFTGYIKKPLKITRLLDLLNLYLT